MRVTVCELPHEPEALAAAWAGTVRAHGRDIVRAGAAAGVRDGRAGVGGRALRPGPLGRRPGARARSGCQRLPELRAAHVVGTRPVTIDGRPFNQGFLWSAAGGLTPLRRKFFLPDEPGSWEARWFDRGDPDFPAFHAGALIVRTQHLHRAVGAGDLRRLRRAGRAGHPVAARDGGGHDGQVAVGGRGGGGALRRLQPVVQPRGSDGRLRRRRVDHQPGGRHPGDARPPTRHSRRSTSTWPPRRRRGTAIPAPCSAAPMMGRDTLGSSGTNSRALLVANAPPAARTVADRRAPMVIDEHLAESAASGTIRRPGTASQTLVRPSRWLPWERDTRW